MGVRRSCHAWTIPHLDCPLLVSCLHLDWGFFCRLVHFVGLLTILCVKLINKAPGLASLALHLLFGVHWVPPRNAIGAAVVARVWGTAKILTKQLLTQKKPIGGMVVTCSTLLPVRGGRLSSLSLGHLNRSREKKRFFSSKIENQGTLKNLCLML